MDLGPVGGGRVGAVEDIDIPASTVENEEAISGSMRDILDPVETAKGRIICWKDAQQVSIRRVDVNTFSITGNRK